jgi:hypothetical protein
LVSSKYLQSLYMRMANALLLPNAVSSGFIAFTLFILNPVVFYFKQERDYEVLSD